MLDVSATSLLFVACNRRAAPTLSYSFWSSDSPGLSTTQLAELRYPFEVRQLRSLKDIQRHLTDHSH